MSITDDQSGFNGLEAYCKAWLIAPNPNKLTTENAESEERSTYKSTTDGPIPLSFKGRHLMQRLRTSTMAAIQFGNWHVFGEAVSRSRAAIARRMGELEARVAAADSFGAWANSIRTNNLIKRCVNAERKNQELMFDYQLLQQKLTGSLTEVHRSWAAERAEWQERTAVDEAFIGLLGDRLGKRLAQIDTIRRACDEAASDARLDP
jgi:hypothetical protein